MQLRGQLKVSLNAVPIEEALQDPKLTEAQKEKLAMIPKIREFAFSELGIKRNDNYTKFFLQDDNTRMWVVSACKPFVFEPYKWSFPIVGSFPYKGFFIKTKAQKERDRLDELNYDTRIGMAGGWSTLGWFNDPVLSGMLKRNEGSLAEVIIHELTHGSVFVKDSIEYNENLATFIGEKGALMYLGYVHSYERSQTEEYLNSESDYRKYATHMLAGANKLEVLYESFTENNSKEDKKLKKDELIENIISGIDTLGLHNPERYLKRFKDGKRPNNADFMSYKRYRDQQGDFEEMFQKQFQGDLKKMIAWLIEKHPA